MKTLRQIVAVGLLLGSYQVGMAQSSDRTSPELEQRKTQREAEARRANLRKAAIKQETFKSNARPAQLESRSTEETKLAKIKAEALEADQRKANAKQETLKITEWNGQKHPALKNSHAVKSQEKFGSEEEKKAWIDANNSPEK